jgi:hypothetical protein
MGASKKKIKEMNPLIIRRLTGEIIYCPTPSCSFKNIYERAFYREIQCPKCHKIYLYDVGDKEKIIK